MHSLIAKRFAAYALDALLLFMLLAPTSYLFQAAIDYTPQSGRQIWYVLLLGFSLPTWTYFTLSDRSRGGATLAKRLLRIRVSTKEGARLTLVQSIGRTALKLLPWELVHVAVFGLSADMADLTRVQLIGLAAANLLALTYAGVAILHSGRASIHDLILRTRVHSTHDSVLHSSA